MARMLDIRLLKKLKVSPIIRTLLLIGAYLLALGLSIEVYGLIARPDLRFRLDEYGRDLPESLRSSQQIDLTMQTEGEKEARTLIVGEHKINYYINPNDPSMDSCTLTPELWLIGDDIQATCLSTISFEFPGHPQQDPSFEASEPWIQSTDNMKIPLVASARYVDRILIIAYIINRDGVIQSESKSTLPLREEILGSALVMSKAAYVRALGTPQGNQDYLAIGFGYCKEPVPGESTSIVSTFNPEYFRPDMVTDLGIVLTPVYQRPQAGQIDWEPPYKTIPIPAAALPFYLEPNGRPCLFAYTGGTGGNGWHTVVSQREIFDSKHPDLVTNDDSWGTYYLINLELDDPINDRIRVGEAMEITNQVDHQDFINIWGISAHTTSVSATECAIMIEPTHADKGFLYTYYSEEKHGTETAPWRFFPESSTVGSPIPYDRTPEHRTAFEDSSQRLGFAYINGPSDEFPTTSIGLLRQPEFYNLQELIGFYELHDNPENPLDVFFLGIVPRKDNGQDIYIFATSDSRMIVLDENCRLIETYPIARQFLWDRSFYQVVPQTGSMYPLRASFPQIVTLTTPRSTRIFEMVMNEAWIPYWSKWKLSAWLALVLLYGILVPFTMQYYRRKGIFSYGELTRSVEEKEMEIGRVHLQHSAKMGSRLGQIADSLAHDLNTPLDAVRKNLELMQDSNPYNIVNEVSTIFHDDQLVRRFLQILSRHTITPIFLSIAEVNSRTDMLEEFLDENYPRHSDYADSFANNGFDQDAVKAFIEEFGPEASIKLILILDREVSARRAIKYSLDQTVLSLGIANRLKNLTSRKAFDIRLGIESALQMVQGDLVARKIKVSQNFENLPSLRGDPVPLIETITIIMQNAIDVLPEGGEIRLNVKRRDNWLLISIGNNGPLIPQESLPKIWQRGFSEGKPGGQGLGLYIAKDLTEQQGGKISVKSEPEWTEFEIRMPLSPTSE